MTKRKLIKYIQELIAKHDSPRFSDMEVESSPCLYSSGQTIILIENISYNHAEAITYVRDEEVDSVDILYENLSNDTLEEILTILEIYDTMYDKTLDRCQD
jgi:LPS sulfotransferase NodH